MPNLDPQLTNSETAGGADAVEKTSSVVGKGTEPEAQATGPTAHPRPGGGPNHVAWGVGVMAVLVALVYLLGMMRG